MKLMKMRDAFGAVVYLLLAAQAVAAQPDYDTFTDRQRRFAVEYPTGWMWEVIAGSAEPMLVVKQPKREAAVAVERIRLKQALPGDEIADGFVQVEVDILKENQPQATDVKPTVISIASGRRLLVINYTRPGGNPSQRVRQYSYSVGKDLYRMTCMAPDADSFRKYESVFDMMVQSLRPAGELGPAPATPAPR
jgi:hypothetical protein